MTPLSSLLTSQFLGQISHRQVRKSDRETEETPSNYITTLRVGCLHAEFRSIRLLVFSYFLTSKALVPLNLSNQFARPSSPENQLASCCPLTLGVRLSALAAPLLLCSGVLGLWGLGDEAVLPLARFEGVGLRLSFPLFLARKLREDDFCVRRRQLERLDEEAVSVLFGVVLLSLYRETSDVSLNSRTRRVGIVGLCERWSGSLGGCASICMGSGTRDRTQGRTL
jgi:hypothetical protein